MLPMPGEQVNTPRKRRNIGLGWLESVLQKYYAADGKNCNVKIRVKGVLTQEGCQCVEPLLSDIISVSADVIINDESEILHFVVKLLPLDPLSRHFVEESQFDLREIKFYTQIAPDLHEFQKGLLPDNVKPIKLPIPTCYYASFAEVGLNESPFETEEESVIVLEDFKHRDYGNQDFSMGLSERQVETALEAVSRLHALSLAMKVRKKTSLCEQYDFLFQGERTSDSYQQLIVERGMPQLTKFLEKKPDMHHIIDRLNALAPNTKHLMEALLAPEEPMAVITHNDFWCNNLLFCNKDCIILDWQTVTCSQPTNDLALLLISSVCTEIRRLKTEDFLDFYWDHLVKYTGLLGVDIENGLGYNRARLSEDYRRSQLLALLLCIGSIDMAFGDEETEQRLVDVITDLYKDGVLSSDIVRSQHLNV